MVQRAMSSRSNSDSGLGKTEQDRANIVWPSQSLLSVETLDLDNIDIPHFVRENHLGLSFPTKVCQTETAGGSGRTCNTPLTSQDFPVDAPHAPCRKRVKASKIGLETNHSHRGFTPSHRLVHSQHWRRERSCHRYLRL
jgi:hypothetical protein